MAKTLVTNVSLNIDGEYDSSSTLSTVKDHLVKNFVDSLATGTGVNQADLLYYAVRTLASAATDNLDLYGGLTDSIGATLNFARIKLLYIKNKSIVAGEYFTVGGHATAAWETWATVAGSKLKCDADGVIFLYTPSTAGFTVTATTADILKIVNSGAASNDYEIVIIGCSA